MAKPDDFHLKCGKILAAEQFSSEINRKSEFSVYDNFIQSQQICLLTLTQNIIIK